MMKNITRRTFLAALGVSATTLLVGCGDSSDSASTTTTTDSTSTSDDAAEEATTVTTTSGTLTEDIIRAYPETDESYFTKSYVDGGVSITGCTSTDEVIVIPETIGGETVVEIDKLAFYECEYRGIVLPDTVTTIGEGAFRTTDSLEAIWLGTGVVEVGAYAFTSCTSLISLTLPEGTITLGGSLMFAYCAAFETLYVPASLESFDTPFSSSTNPDAMVITPAGSAMEAYAIENEIPYETY